MDMHRDDGPLEHVLAVTGGVSAAQAPNLQAELLRALADGDHDVLLDARGMTSFDDAALSALTVARLRSRSVQHRVVVVDAEGGAMRASLHRRGMVEQFPVFPDPYSASAALAADRAEVAAMDSPMEARWRAVRTDERSHRLEDQAWEHVETTLRRSSP